MAHPPLAGLKVLDLTRVLAGPLATMLLGDLGAQVIKIERPGRGDDTRGWGPPFDDRGESAYYLSINRNKFSVTADFASVRDRSMILALMREADVVVENFLPGTLERFGMVAESELERNSQLVWCTITGFESESRRPGYDFVVQAESGWMAITGAPDGDAMKCGVALADLVAGKDAAIAILANLIGRARETPPQRHIVISLSTSARAALINVAQNALLTGAEARRWGNAHANLVPYQLFRASDRPLVIAVGSDEQWQACVVALGLTDLERDAALATNAGRLASRDRVVGALERRLRQQPATHWLRLLAGANVPCGVVKSVLEAIQDAGNASPLTGMPSSVGGHIRYPPPRLDEHGDTIRRVGWKVFTSE